MSNKIVLKKSSVTSKVPLTTDLDYGELALNYTDGKLYYKTSTNTIQSFSAASGAAGNSFTNIAVSGQPTIVADSTTDTLTLVAGTNISLTTDATTDSVTVAAVVARSLSVIGRSTTTTITTTSGSVGVIGRSGTVNVPLS